MPTEVIVRPAAHPKIDAAQVAFQYANDVVSGKITAGKLVRLAAKRFLRDLKNGHKRGLHFSKEEAQRVVDFFGFLHHSKGEYGGTVFAPLPWEVFVLANLFGWLREDGSRRFREGYVEVARGNGKSTLLAGIGLYMLVADDEPGADIYSAAVDKDQARIVFDEAVRMVAASPFLAARVGRSGGKAVNNLHVLATHSKFEPMAREDQSQDGLNIHCALVDELHAHKNREMWDVLAEAARKRIRSLILAITTAGFDRQGICWKQRTFMERLLSGGISEAEGDRFFGFIACIDEGNKTTGVPADDHFDERNWLKANPSLGVTMKVDDLRQAAIKAKEEPSSLNSFLRKHMNVWTSSDTRWMPPEKWAACNAAGPEADPKTLRSDAMLSLAGRTAWGGLDLGSTDDISAFALLFPPTRDKMGKRLKVGTKQVAPLVGHSPNCGCRICENNRKATEQLMETYIEKSGDQKWHLLVWYFVPEQVVSDRVRKARVLYDQWIREGYIEATPGATVDLNFIRSRIAGLRKMYNIVEVGFDEWGSERLIGDLTQDGVAVQKVRQGFKTLSPATKELMALVLDKKLEHYGDPVLSWMADNVQAEIDAAGGIKPNKAKSKEKIDGIAATLDALVRVDATPGAASGGTGSVYETRGIVFI